MKINVKPTTFKRDGETIQGEPTFEFEEFPHMELCFSDHIVEITFDLTCNELTLYILSTPVFNGTLGKRKASFAKGKGKEVQIKLSEVDLPIEKENF